MKREWSVGKKLFWGVGSLAALVLLTGVYAWWSTSDSGSRFDDACARAEKVRLAEELKRLTLDIYAAEKIIILAGYDNDRPNVDLWIGKQRDTATKFHATVEKLSPLIVNPTDRAALTQSLQIVEQLSKTGQEVIDLVMAGQFHEAQALSKSKNTPLISKNEELVAQVVLSQTTRLQAAKESGQHANTVASVVVMAVLLVSAAIALVVGLVVRNVTRMLRDTSVELRSNAEQVLAASTQVSSSAQALSQGATEQAASLEETSASMEEMASMTRRNSENAQQAAVLVVETEKAVQDSNAALGDVVDAMSGIRESSGKISKIIKTIDEIAFQTNILALNAAVEAARAGEAGMGFAVVADEVRNLAQRSAQAAKDTASLIEDAISRSETGGAKVEHMAEVIGAITEKATKVRGLVDEISSASRQQTQGIDQVTQAISQMEKVTQTSAATAEESAAASEELNSQAEMSMQTVASLDRMVGGVVVERAPITGRASKAKVVPIAAGNKSAKAFAPAAPKTGSGAAKAEDVIPFGENTGTFGSF